MADQPITWNGLDAQGNPLRWNTPGLTWGGRISTTNTNKKMVSLRVLLGFKDMTDLDLVEMADEVLQNLYSATFWTSLASATPPKPPPVLQADLQTARDEFSQAIATAGQGGPADTAMKDAKRDTLIGLLRLLALYVQQYCGGALENLLASGFDAVSTNRAQTPLSTPTIRDVRNGSSGQLIVRIGPIQNARCYEVRYALIGTDGMPGPWQSAGLYTNSQRMEVNSLTPGRTYTFQARAIGGSTGQSDWSDAVSHMSM